jgi:hypothetical protein
VLSHGVAVAARDERQYQDEPLNASQAADHQKLGLLLHGEIDRRDGTSAHFSAVHVFEPLTRGQPTSRVFGVMGDYRTHHRA